MGRRRYIYSLSHEGVSEGAEWLHGPRPESCAQARPDDPDGGPDDPGLHPDGPASRGGFTGSLTCDPEGSPVDPGIGDPDDLDGVPDDPASSEAFGCLRRTYSDDPGEGPDDPAEPG